VRIQGFGVFLIQEEMNFLLRRLSYAGVELLPLRLDFLKLIFIDRHGYGEDGGRRLYVQGD